MARAADCGDLLNWVSEKLFIAHIFIGKLVNKT